MDQRVDLSISGDARLALKKAGIAYTTANGERRTLPTSPLCSLHSLKGWSSNLSVARPGRNGVRVLFIHASWQSR